MKKRTFIHSFTHFILFSAMLAFTSCDRSSIVDSTEPDGITSFDQSIEMTSSRTDQLDPKLVSDAFFKMVEEVQKMDREFIDSLSDEDILELGKPILDATKNSVKLGNGTLQKLNNALAGFAESIHTISREEHAKISRDVKQIMATDKSRSTRNLNAEDVRGILIKINGGAATMSSSTMSSSCEDLFNHDPYMGYIHLYPGDYLSIANDLCPAGSIFYVHNGTYNQAYVGPSKDGNYWLGIGGVPILDGQGSVSSAFSGGMKRNTIAYLEIKNYKNHGIYSASSTSTTINIHDMTFKNIAPNHNGQEHGAIMIINGANIWVRRSYFENVTSSIRIREGNGPIVITDNEALNSGRNFFQCDKCNGGEIRINGNSMDRTSSYGAAVLEDWISIYQSHGLFTDPIQVNNNRARGHSNSGSGSFIMLGDDGGTYQQAIGNIGVSPGQVGIGAAGGHYIFISGNKLFSVAWAKSNTGFVSWDHYESGCSNHTFDDVNYNYANWNTPSGVKNAWNGMPNHHCGAVASNVQHDTNMDATVWDKW